MDIDNYRSLFPITERYIFLNHAAVSPASMRVADTVKEFYLECAVQASKGYYRWMERVEKTRKGIAVLINAEPDEIAFVGNTSEGISTIANGLKWKPKEAVLVPVSDFPANVYPWMHLERLGVNVHFIKKHNRRFGLKEIKEALVPGTRMIAVSSVDYASGFRTDLKELGAFCREKGILYCVDAIQSLGVIPMDVKECGIHFLASGGHKWLMGPMGIGVVFVDRQVNEMITPSRIGWKSVVDEEDFRIDFTLKEDALRFEPGTMNFAGIHGLGSAIELLEEVGLTRINKKVTEVNDLFIERLKERNLQIASPLNDNERSGILTFKPKKDPKKCFEFLINRKIMASLRQNRIRIAPHFYNNYDDVTEFFRALDEFSR